MGIESAARAGQELDQSKWGSYFEDLNKRIEDGAEIETTIEVVADPTVATEAERLPLNSITYEQDDDQIAIGVGGRAKRFPSVLWHYVDQPRRVIVTQDDDDEPRAIIIESEDETLTLVRLHES
jgi:hypothetical protein